MIVAKLKISYDRGTSYNKQGDLGTMLKRGDVTRSGGVVRGLGSHFRSEADMVSAQKRDKEANRVYKAFRERFLATMIDGLYIVPGYGAAQKFIDSINPVGIDVRVAEMELKGGAGLDQAEVSDWGERVKRQLVAVNLGRKKDTDEQGLKALGALADCPLLADKTREAVKGLVGLLGSKTINRAGFRERLNALTVEIATEQMDKDHEGRVEAIKGGAAWAHGRVPQAPATPQA